MEHYNTERTRRGIDLNTPIPNNVIPLGPGRELRRNTRLGGLLHAYDTHRCIVRMGFCTPTRLFSAAGFDLEIAPRIHWSRVIGARGQVHHVPDQLFRLPVNNAFRTFEAPLHLEWSKANRTVNLTNSKSRIRWYEIVLREGSKSDVQTCVDGALLLDAWNDMIVPRSVRTHWQDAINRSLGVTNE